MTYGVSKSSTQAVLKTKFVPFDRNKIKIAQIVRRLHEHAMGLIDMSQTQIAAAKILLGKALPDLTHVTHSGSVEETVRYVEVPRKAETVEAWITDHAHTLIDVTPASDKAN